MFNDLTQYIDFDMLASVSVWVWSLIIYSLGIWAALDTIWNSRTSQGSTAWVVALLLMPVISLPLYIFFGNRRFYGYRLARNNSINHARNIFKQHREKKQLTKEANTAPLNEQQLAYQQFYAPLEALSRSQLYNNNQVDLLIDGEHTFASMLSAIKQAQAYILFQFYIIQDDATGRLFQQALIKKAQQGIAVYFIYDEIGSNQLSKSYLKELTSAGVYCAPFNSLRFRNRLQLNFRNHRKLLIIDGQSCFIGGLNIADDYLGLNPKIGYWRDSHVKIQGPACQTALRTFLEDWYWAAGQLPNIDWQTDAYRSSEEGNKQYSSDAKVLILPTGPADHHESMSLALIQCIMQAKQRILIATPYFVPDYKILSALKLAALKGIKIDIILPKKSDSWMISNASHSFIEELKLDNIQFHQYKKGFNHQKIMIIDDQLTLIGSANLDNRSLRINFEISALIEDQDFNQRASRQFQLDINNSCQYQAPTGFIKRLTIKSLRLISPIL